MKTPIYRNLDKPFQILGFNYIELTLFTIIFVINNEIANFFQIHRFWAISLTLLFAFCLFLLRKTLGNNFGYQLIRFLRLPSQLSVGWLSLWRTK